MADRRLILDVDLDGVCGDFYGCMREIFSEYAEIPLEQIPVADSFSLNCWGIQTRQDYEDFHRFAVTQKNLFSIMPIMPGARKYLRKLSDEGVRIRIVTHRLCIKYFHKEAVVQTVEWLEKNGIPFWDLCFLKSKTDIYADAFIEDTPHNIDALRKLGVYTICFANSTNIDVSNPRAESWEEVYNLVKEREQCIKFS